MPRILGAHVDILTKVDYIKLAAVYWHQRSELPTLIHVYWCRRILHETGHPDLSYLTRLKRALLHPFHPDRLKDEGARDRFIPIFMKMAGEFDALMYEARQNGTIDHVLDPNPEPCPIGRTLEEDLTAWTPSDRVPPLAEENITRLMAEAGYLVPIQEEDVRPRPPPGPGARRR